MSVSVTSHPGGLLGSPFRNLALGVGFTLVVGLAATIAYHLAGWPWSDAVYMVVVTVYTVGYGEVHPVESPLLRGITIATIVFGCTGMIFVTGALVQFITMSQINQVFGVRRMAQQIENLSQHVIICGFGAVGEGLAQGLAAGNAPFVVVEPNEARVARARDRGYLCLCADATDDAGLRTAGIMRARALATVVSNDAANLYITLTARGLNPALEIVARGDQPGAEQKLLQAGANKVVMPSHIGAERIAEILLYQETARFIRGSERMADFERVLRSLGLEMEVVGAAPGGPIVGQTIETVEGRANGAFFIVQLNRRNGDAITQPGPDTRIEPGDGIVIVGRGAKARSMRDLFSPTAFRVSVR